jgi:hypothetical protein
MIRDVPVLLSVPALARYEATFTFNQGRREYCSLSVQATYLKTLCLTIHYAASNDGMMVNIRRAKMMTISIVA